MITLTPEQQQDVARRFQGLATRWIATARYRSNTQALRNHAVYQELVAMGEPVVPLILVEWAGINSSHCGLFRRTIRAGRRLPMTQGCSIALASKMARSLMPGAASLARRARWKFSIWVITMPSHSSP